MPADAVAVLETDAAGPAIIRGGVVRVGGFLANVLLSVGSAALLIRYLGPSGYGAYTIAISLTSVVAGLTEAGTTNIGVREYTTLEPSKRARMLGNLMGMRLVATGVGVAVACGFGIVAGYSSTVVLGVLVGGLSLLILSVQANLGIPLLVGLRLGRATGLELLRQVTSVVLTVALIAAGGSLLALLAVPLPAAALALLATIPMVRGLVSWRPAFDWPEWRRLIGVLLPYALTTALGVMYAYIAVLLLSLLSTDTETGYFGAAFRVFLILSLIPGTVVTTAFPLLAHAAQDDEARLQYALQRMFEVSLLGGILMTGATVLGAQTAIDVLAGSEFAPAVVVLQVQAIGLIGTFFAAVWGFALLALDRRNAILGVNAFTLCLTFGLVSAVARKHGANGAAWGTAAGETALGVLYLVMLARARPTLRPSLALVPRVLALTAVAVALPLVLDLPSLPAAITFSIVFAGGAVVIRAVPPEVADALLRRRRPT